MKKTTFTKWPLFALISAITFSAVFLSCQKDSLSPDLTSNAKPVPGGNCTGYLVDLAVDKATIPGSTIFTWTITNPTPGNGSGSTIQDLSHWDFVPGLCLDQNWQDVVSASYRYGTTGDFVSIDFTGSAVNDIKPDPSLKKDGCYGDDVFKFDYGTSGSTPTQYRLVLSGNWRTDALNLYFKSGTNTGCCFNSYAGKGVGCPESEDCSFSQGYWFANNAAHPNGVHPWTSTLTEGGKIYSNAEGLAIWNASNKGGITDSKKAFTQLAAIRLSGVDETDPSISSAIATIDNWFAHINKLKGSAPIYLPNQTSQEIALYGNARNAAGVISTWITANHCQ